MCFLQCRICLAQISIQFTVNPIHSSPLTVTHVIHTKRESLKHSLTVPLTVKSSVMKKARFLWYWLTVGPQKLNEMWQKSKSTSLKQNFYCPLCWDTCNISHQHRCGEKKCATSEQSPRAPQFHPWTRALHFHTFLIQDRPSDPDKMSPG